MNNFEDKDLDAITYLFSSSASSFHIVHASLDALEFFSSKDLGGLAKRQIENIKKKYFSFKSLTTQIKHRIVVFKKECILKGENQFPIEISTITAQLPKTVLLCENNRDAYFYRSLAKQLAVENGQQYDIAVDIGPGGGSQIAEVARNYIMSEKKFTLVIVDSDRKYEGDIKGKTATLLESVSKEFPKDAVYHIHTLNVREVENLIPPSFYVRVANKENKVWLSKLEKMEKDPSCYEFLKFSDFKSNVKDCCKVSNYQKIINALEIDDSKGNIKVGDKDLRDFNNNFLEHGVESDRKKFLSRVNGEKVEKQKWFDERVNFSNHIDDNLPEYIKESWHKIYRLVADFGCCLTETYYM